jgi:hypothetical protein
MLIFCRVNKFNMNLLILVDLLNFITFIDIYFILIYLFIIYIYKFSAFNHNIIAVVKTAGLT